MTTTLEAAPALESPVVCDRDALAAACIAAPNDAAPRLIFADWLDEHGEPTVARHLRRIGYTNPWDVCPGKDTCRVVAGRNYLVAYIGGPRSLDTLTDHVGDLLATHNGGSVVRTVSDDAVVRAIARRIGGCGNDRRSDLIEVNGGGVANAYKYRAESTTVLAAVTKVRGGWVVAIAANRLQCNGNRVSLPIGTRIQREYKQDDHAFFVRLIAGELERGQPGKLAKAKINIPAAE